MSYKTIEVGEKYTESYKMYILNNEKVVSPMHDIPYKEGHINMVCEIPRNKNGKFEISLTDKFNPIKQDVKKGKVRFVKDHFPFKGYPWHYGAIPQTWENPNEKDPLTGIAGDNDPLDVIDIGTAMKKSGDVYQIKILGALGLIDGGETDWKIIGISADDELCNELNDISDVERLYPDILTFTRSWFRNYKIPDGKPANNFALDERYLNKEEALSIIEHAHNCWKALIEKGSDKIELINSTLKETGGFTKDFTYTGLYEGENSDILLKNESIFYIKK